MANRSQVLERLAMGMTPNEIAAELGCDPAYVRATRLREAKGASYWKQFPSYERSLKTKKKRRQTDPDYRAKLSAQTKAYRMRRDADA